MGGRSSSCPIKLAHSSKHKLRRYLYTSSGLPQACRWCGGINVGVCRVVLFLCFLLKCLLYCFVWGGNTPMELLGGSPEFVLGGSLKWLSFLHSHHRHAGVTLVRGHPVQKSNHPLVCGGPTHTAPASTRHAATARREQLRVVGAEGGLHTNFGFIANMRRGSWKIKMCRCKCGVVLMF